MPMLKEYFKKSKSDTSNGKPKNETLMFILNYSKSLEVKNVLSKNVLLNLN